MKCTSPFSERLLPCGQCLSCRLTRATEWAVRCLHERSLWKKSCFATLTYDDAHLPRSGYLDQEEFTKFWKRLRKNAARRIRYYGSGEYGEKDGRPHYHAIIFGVSPREEELVKRSWGNGFVYLGTVTPKSVRYTADYVGKQVALVGRKDVYRVLTGEFYGERPVPFAVMSQGLGRGFVDGNREQLLRMENVTINGSSMGLPRYYRQRLGLKPRTWQQVLPDLFFLSGVGPEKGLDHVFDSLDQVAANRAAKYGLLGRKGTL